MQMVVLLMIFQGVFWTLFFFIVFLFPVVMFSFDLFLLSLLLFLVFCIFESLRISLMNFGCSYCIHSCQIHFYFLTLVSMWINIAFSAVVILFMAFVIPLFFKCFLTLCISLFMCTHFANFLCIFSKFLLVFLFI